MDSHDGQFDPEGGMSLDLVRGVAELGRLLEQTDPASFRSLEAIETETVTGMDVLDAGQDDLGDQLRAVIARSGLTSTALAKQSGVSTGVILRFVSGERDITLQTASRLAAALQVRFNPELIEQQDEVTKALVRLRESLARKAKPSSKARRRKGGSHD
jgi:transcriptional regulator with XRE-family HTH domain